MSSLRQGRGFGRGRGGGRIPTNPNIYKGSIPTIGAYLSVPIGRSPSASFTTIWSSKLGEYAMATFTSGIHKIFGENGTTGDYPSREELEVPASNDKVQFEIWKVEFSSNRKFKEKLESEKTQLFGVMLGQMSETSKDLIRETSIGRQAFVDKDPLMLLQGALQTHMSDSRLGGEQNLYMVQSTYSGLHMEQNETVSSYYQRFKASLAAVSEAHIRCSNDPIAKMDDDLQRSMKFIYGLSTKYSEYKSFFENRLIEFPLSLEEAFSDASVHRINREDGMRHQSRIDMFVSSGRGRGRSSMNSGRGRGTKPTENSVVPICYKCGKEGHKSNVCRSTAASQEQQDIARAISEQRRETASKSSSK